MTRSWWKAILIAFLTLGFLGAPEWALGVGTWKAVTTFPYSGAGHMLLLSDASVLVFQDESNQVYRLTPDGQGHYYDGNWTTVAPMLENREFFSTDLLQSGKVFLAGGEDGNGKANAEIFDPQANSGYGSWTHVNPPSSLMNTNDGDAFLDSPSIVLDDGTVMIAPVYAAAGNGILIFNPFTSSWSATGATIAWQDEATWLKLPDDSILTIDVRYAGYSPTTSERYIPSLGVWLEDTPTPTSTDGTGAETGGALMLASGKGLFLCGSGRTLLYTPSGNTNRGSWTQGPIMPQLNTSQYPADPIPLSTNNGVVTYNNYLQLSPEDAPCAIMPNGKVLCELARDGAHNPVWFYEYDPVAQVYNPAPCPTDATNGSFFTLHGSNSDNSSMLVLPDGTILYNDSAYLYVYQPDNSAILASGQPAIDSVTMNPDGSLEISGTLLNGTSQGASYGDDFQMDSNFPLVRFTDSSGNVSYGRTYNWSSTSIMTGSKVLTTQATVPAAVFDYPGNYSLQIVANGNASGAVNYSAPVWVDFNYSSSYGFYFGWYPDPYNTLPEGVSAVPSGGTIAIKAVGLSSTGHETVPYTITNSMTIISYGGPSTIGN